MKKEEAKQKVEELCERFRYNLDVYKRSTYNEAQVRREFIDPFFEALGWDVSNTQGYAEQYKEVIHEDTIKVGRSTRAPDYSFRIGGQRKFFVEAKKPAVNIKEDVSPSYQLRRYAWSAKLPLSVVTDFEEFSVFDCRIKPNPNDKPSVGRIAYYTFDEYLDKFDEIYDVFSREAILKGSFDRYAQSTKGKKGTAEVDSEFLKEIESWREMMAKNIALRNPEVSIYELNYAVQKLVDRIIFLRICEDRGIEPYGQLQTKAESGGEVYKHLLNHFKLAETKYNSGIFDFDADKITSTLRIDDKILKTIIQSLYYPKSPYEFSVLGVEILGNVYEQFLGKVIRLTAGHQAKVETKPEVKKAGGVYYTPQYIVEYIVKNTVGNLIEGKTPDEIAELKILDPACGSGSFLIGAYTYLLRYHLDWYAENKPKKHKDAVFQVRENEWYLTTVEKKRILLNNVFGVDIDPQAVEVTKLSLLLKVLEHESRESIDQQVKLGLEGVLPNLVGNIKCGNSLIGPDYYDAGQQETLFDEAEMRRINVFDWNDNKKGFGEIMKRGGFDVVIGNPPWGADFGKKERSYLVNRYPLVPTKTKDSYLYFLFQAIDLVCDTGFLGFIVPNTWLLVNSAKELRRELLSLNIKEIVDHGDGVFKQATVESATLLLVKSKDVDGKCRAARFRKGTKVVDHLVDKRIWLEDEYCRIIIEMDKTAQQLLEKLRSKSEPFEKRCTIIWGIKPYQVGHGIPPQTREMLEKRVYHSTTKRGEDWKPFLVGSNVNRYRLHFPGNQFIKYGKWLMYPSNETLILQPKILMRQTSDSIRACYDEDCYYCQNSVFIIHASEINLKFLLGLLNSKLLNFVYKLGNPQTSKVFAEIKPRVIKQLPIYRVDLTDPNEKAQHDKLVTLVENMLELQTKYHGAKMERDKELYERQIKIVDAQIDRRVYDLYGLTEEVIEIVEGVFN